MTENLAGDRPLFQQIADMLEGAIVSGAYGEDSQIPSITELSVAYAMRKGSIRCPELRLQQWRGSDWKPGNFHQF